MYNEHDGKGRLKSGESYIQKSENSNEAKTERTQNG